MVELPPYALGAALVFLALALLLRSRVAGRSRIVGRAIMTANEREFFYRLCRALPTYHIFPQVVLGALLDVDRRVKGRRRWAQLRRIGYKRADFVVCERGNLAVVVVVELDDRTHDARADRARDRLVSAGGFRTVRFDSRAKPSEAELAALFEAAR